MSAWVECRECGRPLNHPDDDDDRGYCSAHKAAPAPSGSTGGGLRQTVVHTLNQYGIYNESHQFTELVDAIMQLIEADRRAIEKAYGGCRLCYGKGYATVIEYASGFDTDEDIGSPGGKVFFRQSPMRYCKCGRGKQLAALMEAKS